MSSPGSIFAELFAKVRPAWTRAAVVGLFVDLPMLTVPLYTLQRDVVGPL